MIPRRAARNIAFNASSLSISASIRFSTWSQRALDRSSGAILGRGPPRGPVRDSATRTILRGGLGVFITFSA
jgi:hypothetical protein